MKFSIIVPVYNTEKYLDRSIKSILNQTYQNYEIIAVDDGSTDNSEKLLHKYERDNRFRLIRQANHGLSYSRNVGIQEATGDYIIFLDSDDYLDICLLEKLNESITDEEMIKFSYKELKSGNLIEAENIEFKHLAGLDAFIKLIESGTMFEMAWLYAYKREFMARYEFAVGKYHEDFGLIPLMLKDCSNVSSILFYGYIYNRDNTTSITSYNDEEKEYKKALDTLYFFKEAKRKTDEPYILSFYSNGCINRIKRLNGKFKKLYIDELKKEKILDCILTDTIKRKLKKVYLKIKWHL